MTTLILGGNGKTGRRVADRLAERGLPYRLGSRSAEPRFDWADQSTWEAALTGAESVYVSYNPDLAVPGADDAVRALAEVAVSTGVHKLVLLSGRGEEHAQLAEQELQKSGADWTIVRCAWFNQNFSEGWLIDSVRSGEVVMPVGDTVEPFVDADDIADVAVAALTEDGHSGELYELTGPRMLTFADAVAEIATATGREIRYVRISMEEYMSGISTEDVGSDVVWLLGYLFTEVLDGRNAFLTDGVQRALGRGPRDFAEFVRETAATGVWNP